MAVSTNPQPIYKPGEIIVFKASGIPRMVVISCTLEKVNCMYYNTVTGKFETKDVPVIAVRRPPTT